MMLEASKSHAHICVSHVAEHTYTHAIGKYAWEIPQSWPRSGIHAEPSPALFFHFVLSHWAIPDPTTKACACPPTCPNSFNTRPTHPLLPRPVLSCSYISCFFLA